MQHYHLVKKANFWRLEEEGTNDAIFSAETKADALAQTEEFMSDKRGAVWIHKADGELQEERNYGADADRERSSILTWATVLTLGVTFAAGCALAWYYRKDLRDIDLDRLRSLLPR